MHKVLVGEEEEGGVSEEEGDSLLHSSEHATCCVHTEAVIPYFSACTFERSKPQDGKQDLEIFVVAITSTCVLEVV